MKKMRALVFMGMALALVAAACSSGSSDSAEAADTPVSEEATSAPSNDDGTSAEEPTAEPAETSGTYEPGSVEFRAVNLLDVPVDIYVRTTGLVEAFAIQQGVAPGAVTQFVAPPEGGRYVVTDAGAGDPTCVSGCDHFIVELSGTADGGPVQTVILYEDEFSGPRGFDLWEQPIGDQTGTSNAMVQAQTLSALAVVTAVAVTDADFGLRIRTNLTDGCLDPVNVENILIGGNQTPAFALDSATSFTLHDNQDRECAEPGDGPFAFSAGPGSRTHILLTGSPGSLDAIQVPMTVGEIADVATNADDRSAVIALMVDELVGDFGLPGDQAACVSELIVDAVGTQVLYDGAGLIDLDALPSEMSDLATAALINSVEICGLDPSVLGG